MCVKVIASQRWDVFWDTVYKGFNVGLQHHNTGIRLIANGVKHYLETSTYIKERNFLQVWEHTVILMGKTRNCKQRPEDVAIPGGYLHQHLVNTLIYRLGKKTEDIRFDCPHIQNAWTNVHGFWHTTTPLCFEHIGFYVDQIHNRKWRHLAIKSTTRFLLTKSSEATAFDCPYL